MEIRVKIQSIDGYEIAKDLFTTDALERNKTDKAVVEGITLRFNGVARILRASVGDQSDLILQFTLSIGQNVVLPTVVGILSSYLYDKLKERKAQGIKIGDAYTSIDEKQIYQAIMKELPKQADNK